MFGFEKEHEKAKASFPNHGEGGRSFLLTYTCLSPCVQEAQKQIEDKVPEDYQTALLTAQSSLSAVATTLKKLVSKCGTDP